MAKRFVLRIIQQGEQGAPALTSSPDHHLPSDCLPNRQAQCRRIHSSTPERHWSFGGCLFLVDGKAVACGWSMGWREETGVFPVAPHLSALIPSSFLSTPCGCPGRCCRWGRRGRNRGCAAPARLPCGSSH